MQDSFYHMALKSHFISEVCIKNVGISTLENMTFLWTSTPNVTT